MFFFFLQNNFSFSLFFVDQNKVVCMILGLLGVGQKTCPEETFPFCKLAYFLLKVLGGMFPISSPLDTCLMFCLFSSILCYLSFIFRMFLFCCQALESFYERFDPDFINIRTKAREVLQREDDLNEIVQVCFIISKFSSLLRSPMPKLYIY